MAQMNAIEMFNELIRLGYFVPATVDPSNLMMPTAYVSLPTTLAFATPPMQISVSKDGRNAKLGARAKGNSKRKR